MTKKAKKKSLKTGSKSSDGPRSTTVVCGTNAGNKCKFKIVYYHNAKWTVHTCKCIRKRTILFFIE